MRKIERLKARARESAKFRGHKLGQFRHHNTANTWAVAICKACGVGVLVNIKPAPNEIDIGGEAVAIGCKGG